MPQPSKTGFVLNGIEARDRAGSVEAAGDINGDGIDDVIIGAFGAHPNGDYSGQSYVVFGKAGGFDPAIQLAALLPENGGDGSRGFVLNGIAEGDDAAVVSGAGDINGDGFDDVIIGAPGANPRGSYYSYSGGESYVVFGKAGGFDPVIELSELDGSNGFSIETGNARLALFGRDTSGVGDVNGDGFDDVIIGSDAYGALHAYVVFGTNQGFPASITVDTLDGTNGFMILGGTGPANHPGGLSVSEAGDINGDGLNDLVLGNSYEGQRSFYEGESYVVFGNKDGFPAVLDVETLDGTNGFRLRGIAQQDYAGDISGAGDVNGDGFNDVIIGAFGADPNGDYSGQSYVVFGKAGGFDPLIELADLLPENGGDGSRGFVLNGIAKGDNAAVATGAGDFNGDGFDDVIIGAPHADAGGAADAGQAYLVFGKSGGFDPVIELSSLDGTNGFAINGIARDNSAGGSVSRAGDVNFDGFDDLIIGAPFADANGQSSGQSYVLFGGPTGRFGASLNVADLLDTDAAITTPAPPRDMAVGSFDGASLAALVTEPAAAEAV